MGFLLNHTEKKKKVILLSSSCKADFRKVAQVNLEGEGQIYVNDSGSVTYGTMPDSLFCCCFQIMSEIIYLHSSQCVCACVHVHACTLGVQVNAVCTRVPISQNTAGKSKYRHIGLDNVFFKMLYFTSCL